MNLGSGEFELDPIRSFALRKNSLAFRALRSPLQKFDSAVCDMSRATKARKKEMALLSSLLLYCTA
jgi:hypothetical protein